MNAESNQPGGPEADLAAAQARIRELEEKLYEVEQELAEATEIIAEQQVNFECLRTQIEEAGFTIDELTATRRKLEQRVADLEDDLADEPCHVPVTQAEGDKSPAALPRRPILPPSKPS